MVLTPFLLLFYLLLNDFSSATCSTEFEIFPHIRKVQKISLFLYVAIQTISYLVSFLHLKISKTKYPTVLMDVPLRHSQQKKIP